MLRNPASAENLILFKAPSQRNVSSLSLHLQGELAGQAELVLLLDDKPYHTEQLTGHIDLHWRGDWHAGTAKLQYRPAPHTTGACLVEYQFFD